MLETARTGSCTAADAPIAVCYSGEFRTLDTIEDNVHTATKGFATKSVTFLFLSASQNTSSACSKLHGYACSRPRSVSLREGTSWTAVSDHLVRATFKRMGQWSCGVSAWYAPSSVTRPPLCLGDAEQYWKVQQVFAEVQRFEEQARHGKRFEWLLRMRTDIWFLSPLPSPSSLDARAIYVPFGMVSTSVPVNDQVAIVPRGLASAYFDAADDLSCNSSKHTSNFTKFSPKTFLRDRLRRTGASVVRLDFSFVLLRAGIGATCWRLKSHPRTQPWWPACLNLSMSLPLYCILPNGTGHPNSNPGWERAAAKGHDVLSVTRSPRCSELSAGAWAVQRDRFAGSPWPTATPFLVPN